MFDPISLGLISAGTLGSAAINAFGSHGSVSQGPLETPEQTRARQLLLNFGSSGTTPWGYNINQSYGGPLGNYSMTPLETQGQGALASTLSMGNPGIFNTGVGTINNLLSTNNYDPNNDGGVYAGLSAGLDKNTQLATDATKAGAAYQGNLYSTNASRGIADIQSNAASQKSNILAQLYQNFTNQRLAGASTAINAGAQDQSMNLARIGASQQYGALARTLQDTQARDAYSAWLTQRSSELQPIQALSNVSGTNSNFGVSSIPTANPWNSLLNTLTSTGGYLAGMNYGQPSGAGAQPTNPYTPTPTVGPAQGPQPNWGYYPSYPPGGSNYNDLYGTRLS